MTLNEQQAICDAATPGPWHHAVAVVRDDWDRDLLIAEERVPYLNREEIEAGKPSVRTREELQGICEFCATARTEWPALIEEHRKALAEIERLREAMRVGCRAMGWPEDGSWLVHARDSAEQIEKLNAAGKVLADNIWKQENFQDEDAVEQARRVFGVGL